MLLLLLVLLLRRLLGAMPRISASQSSSSDPELDCLDPGRGGGERTEPAGEGGRRSGGRAGRDADVGASQVAFATARLCLSLSPPAELLLWLEDGLAIERRRVRASPDGDAVVGESGVLGIRNGLESE